MKHLKSKQEIWKRELEYVKQPEIWKSFAVELNSCAEMLERNWNLHYEDRVVEGGMTKMFFAPKFIRMFWGFALENLMKGILLATDEQDKYKNKAGGISWGKNGHNLIWLKDELDYAPVFPNKMGQNIDVDFYLDVWGISAAWYGKYPFPAGMNGVLDEYKSLESSEALLRRSLSGNRSITPEDVLHGSISNIEKIIYTTIFEDLSLKSDSLKQAAKKS